VKGDCSVPTCTDPARYLDGYCNSHHARVKKTGEVRADVPLTRRQYGRPKNEWMQERAALNRARIDAIKLESGCVDCGYCAHAVALQFDHVRGEKSFNIGNKAQSGRWEDIVEEMTKCDIVCANCHMIRTNKRRKGESI